MINDQKMWVPTHIKFIEDIINDILFQELKVPGLVLRKLIDEYQKSVSVRNKYTRFYNEYIVGNAKHIPIKDDKYYYLELNLNGDIIARRAEKIETEIGEDTVSSPDIILPELEEEGGDYDE